VLARTVLRGLMVTHGLLKLVAGVLGRLSPAKEAGNLASYCIKREMQPSGS
jgi:hypothetical protein